MAKHKRVKGLVHLKHKPKVERLDPSFQWPNRAPSKEAQLQFSARLNELLAERQQDHTDLAVAIYGKAPNKDGYLSPQSPGTTRGWRTGAMWPRAKRAEDIARVLAVPLDSLTTARGSFVMPDFPKGGAAAAKRKAKANGNGKANGHGNGHAHPVSVAHDQATPIEQPPPPLIPPKNAKPLTIAIKSVKGSPDWTELDIRGTVPSEQALSEWAMLQPGALAHPKRHR